MSRESVEERILSDAKAEAQSIEAEANRRAEEILNAAKQRAERAKKGTEAEVAAKADGVKKVRAAAARLEGKKLLLEEKRKVLDEVYNRALERLINLDEKSTLALIDRLLAGCAEEGDEIIFAADFKYKQAVSKLDIVKELKLKVTPAAQNIRGGISLKGKTADKDISYGALLDLDREEHQAELAAAIFGTD